MDQPLPTVTLPTAKFAPRFVEVHAPSGRKYVLRELTSFEQMQADTASSTTAESIYYRMGLSIDVIDDEKIAPRVKRDFVDLLLKQIPGPDGDALVLEYAKAFSPTAQAEPLKNESAPSD